LARTEDGGQYARTVPIVAFAVRGYDAHSDFGGRFGNCCGLPK
jgi:hypothetical protein